MKSIQPEKQPKDRLYDMEIIFSLDVGLKSVDNILQECGFMEMPTSTRTHVLSQVVPFIPDEELLKRYARIIKETFEKNGEISCRSVRFAGYRKLLMVETDNMDNDNTHNRKEEQA